ncbi:MAG: Glu-tRNA(Gln) amidotransferase subunit GatE [Candidatus Methanolliviera hydrocarbonicum]|uniref:Glutamyl-tRNA(Gln) amidotransferase subunit E n=1 Tax=Candidatus Methanolliviera hydrocarbonicum TaxID=2491085 RepID=A0A520KWA8_9EURY|nr:MAG: Glu-tRNA(Gln) amidotransferase subunit GatE [Candidatus Methanolliviera hydrocarbonicum]
MLNYEELGFKAGLEVHQQLNTGGKLFCRCPTILRDEKEVRYTLRRYLRASESELGEIDRAAREEEKIDRKITYIGYDTTCLVENDEEPPRPLNEEALEISLVVASLLRMKVVDWVYVMRKTVIDGSNTAGFQRTAFVASDGVIESNMGDVGIDTLCLEEDAAQKLREDKGEVTYSLDRLGIPLIEMGTAAEIRSPMHGREIAEKLGMVLRSTGRVKRGIGTIRQDVNVSIRGGARVEIKGVQNLRSIEEVMEKEVLRQIELLKVRDELKNRGATAEREIFDLSDLLKSNSFAINLKGFNGFERLEKEFSDRVKKFGLEIYDLDKSDLARLKERMNIKEEDLVFLIEGEKKKVLNALNSVLDRAEAALKGIPEETRRALPDGTTEYLRPLPGSARMYPETDIEPVFIDPDRLKRILNNLPELIDERKKRYMEGYSLNEDLAGLIAKSEKFKLFEEIMEIYDLPATLVVRTLETTVQDLRRDRVKVDNLSKDHFISIFKNLAEGKIAKEGIPEILRFFAEDPDRYIDEVIERSGKMDLSGAEEIIEEIVQEKLDFIKERGKGSFSPLMGLVMRKLRGKVDGKVVGEILEKKISESVSQTDR